MSPARGLALTAVLSLALGGLGAWGGARLALRHAAPPAPLHELLHAELHLSPAQAARLAALEADHARRMADLDRRMRAADSDLAHAIDAHHAYTPDVQAAIDRLHGVMSEAQKETILHVLAMRAVLTPSQAARFDRTLDRTLTQAAR